MGLKKVSQCLLVSDVKKTTITEINHTVNGFMVAYIWVDGV